MSRGLRWKESTSLILAFKSGPTLGVPSQVFNYKLLFLGQSECDGKHFPSHHLNFPRGTAKAADFSPQWFPLLENASKMNGKLHPVTKIDRKPRPPVLLSDTYVDIHEVYGTDKILAPDIALRLAALRQTYLESGILFARKEDDSFSKATNVQSDISKWLPRVRNEPSEFLQLCERSRCCPDVWSLHEWSNWLTPPYSSSYNQRFDTLYFVCIMNEEMVTHQEFTSVKSWTPEEALKLYADGKVVLSPEQLYDLGRLRRFNNLQELASFSKQRAKYGLDRWCAIRIYGRDGFVSVISGDDLYPSKVDLTVDEPKYGFMEKSIQEVAKMTQNANRFEKSSSAKILVNCNVALPHGHMIPLCSTDYSINQML